MFRDDEERKAHIREYNRKWYQLNKDRILQRRKQHNEELKNWLREYKSSLCCIICGENHPACLQFHHRNKENKSFSIGTRIGRWRYITQKKLEEEISKCEVLCGNCHALLHWRENHEFDNWLDILSPTE